jgi:hypothetical protein
MKQLEAEGCALAKAVAEYVLTCFQSWDSQISLGGPHRCSPPSL